MPYLRAVIDTSVFIAALRSRSGASNLLLRMALLKRVEIAVSVPLVLEYEAVGKTYAAELGMTPGDFLNLTGVLSITHKSVLDGFWQQLPPYIGARVLN